MTKFIKKNFERREYTTYEGKFVARFKQFNAAKSRTHFINFLVDNFTVEEYFNLLDSGLAPLKVLETKGYKSYNYMLAKGLL